MTTYSGNFAGIEGGGSTAIAAAPDTHAHAHRLYLSQRRPVGVWTSVGTECFSVFTTVGERLFSINKPCNFYQRRNRCSWGTKENKRYA